MGMRGMGSGLRRAISNWYTSKDPDDLAYQVTKYNSRNNWSHKGILRLVHPKTTDEKLNSIFRYLTSDNDIKSIRTSKTTIRKLEGETRKDEYSSYEEYPRLFDALEEVKHTSNDTKVAKLVEEYNLSREHLPTIMLNSKAVWRALLKHMGMTAMIRNLGKMSSMGMLDELSSDTIAVIGNLTDEVKIQKSRLHPLSIYLAMRQYGKGQGDKGSLTWSANPKILTALESAFYSSFKYIKPSNKRFSINLDVSGSMGGGSCAGLDLLPVEATSIISMALYKSEPLVHVGLFADRYMTLDMTNIKTLDQMKSQAVRNNFGATDPSLAILTALKEKRPVDVFVIMTDNEVNSGVHPSEALKKYRKETGINAKLLVMATSVTKFSVADPKDPLQMDIAGMSSDVPAVMSWFANS